MAGYAKFRPGTALDSARLNAVHVTKISQIYLLKLKLEKELFSHTECRC